MTPEQARLYLEHEHTDLHTGDAYYEGCPTCDETDAFGGLYSEKALSQAESRGFDFEAHLRALVGGDEDEIGLTHPINWLDEAEAESYMAGWSA